MKHFSVLFLSIALAGSFSVQAIEWKKVPGVTAIIAALTYLVRLYNSIKVIFSNWLTPGFDKIVNKQLGVIVDEAKNTINEFDKTHASTKNLFLSVSILNSTFDKAKKYVFICFKPLEGDVEFFGDYIFNENIMQALQQGLDELRKMSHIINSMKALSKSGYGFKRKTHNFWASNASQLVKSIDKHISKLIHENFKKVSLGSAKNWHNRRRLNFT
jgi:hypothetical protein